MTGEAKRTARRAAALALAAAGGLAAAAGGPLHRLPTDYVFARGDGSPGPVTFSHASHVDAAKPACVAWHPRIFRITETGRPQDRERITHARMEKGAACGACHGKAAFGLDGCDACHRS
jgi:c(7)-type cytochrome triheme protein